MLEILRRWIGTEKTRIPKTSVELITLVEAGDEEADEEERKGTCEKDIKDTKYTGCNY